LNKEKTSYIRYFSILLTIIVTIIYAKVVLADLIVNVSTTNSCSSNQIALLRLQNDSGGYENSHAQLANYSGTLYSNTLCAISTNNLNLNNTCSQNFATFLRLSNNTNAHVQNASNTTYLYPACISNPTQSLTCRTSLNNCPSGDTCILSIASDTGNNATNAHVGSCNKYQLKICCSLNSPPNLPILALPLNNTFFNNNTPQFFINNSDDPDNDTIYYILEISTGFTFATTNYYNGTIRKITNNTNSHNISNSLSNGIYYWRARATDLQGNSSYSEIRNFTIDTINPLINFTIPTEANNSYKNQSYILINTSITETNVANVTFRIFNTTSLVNLSFFNNATNQVNISVSNLNERYHYNVTIIDSANNQNITETRIITLDATLPTNVTLLSPANNTVSTNRIPLFTWNNVTEINFDNYTLEIDNDADFSSVQFTYTKYNSLTNSTHLMTTPLNDNTRYYWRIKVTDKANNQNSTTFTYTTDNTNPSVTLNSPSNNQWLTTTTNNFQYIPSDTPFNINLQACDLYGNFTTSAFEKNNTQVPIGGAINTFTLTLSDSSYAWNVQCNDSAGNKVFATANFTVNIDTVKPSLSYSAQTLANNTYSRSDSIFVNWTYTEFNFANLTFRLFNTTSSVNITIYNTTAYQINITNINTNERYTYNLTLIDYSLQQNSTETRILILDTVLPVIVYSSQTLANNTYLGQSSIFVNWTYTETNFANLTFTLTNSTKIINQTIYSVTAYQINLTNLPDNNYTYNVTIRDKANNVNTTDTRTIVLDTRVPSISYSPQTRSNNSYVTEDFIFVNWTYTEDNVANITFRLFNTTSNVNTTVYHETTYQIYVSNYTHYLINPNEIYTYNITIIDQLGNQNITETRKITLDNINPASITLLNPTNGSYLNNLTPLFDWGNTVETNFDNYTLQITTDITFASINNTFILYNNLTNSTINLTNNLVDNTRYYWKVLVYDKSNKFNASTQNFTFNTDATMPLISLGTRTQDNNSQIQQNWIYVNVSYTELSLSNLTFRLFNSTSLINETVSNSSNIIRSINYTGLPNSNNVKYYYNVTITDLANNQNITETRTILLDNVLPSIPVLGNPNNDTWQLFDNTTLFDWSNSRDYENTSITFYEFQLSNSTAFNSTYFIRNINVTQSNFTLSVNDMPSTGRHYWRVRSYDGINYSNYSNLYEVDVVYAVINITLPAYNSITRILNNYAFKVEEIANQNWVLNANITFVNGGSRGPYAMENTTPNLNTNYTYNYTIPNVESGYLIVTATGWNGTRQVNATSRFRITVPETPTITRPTISEIYSENTYTYPNVSANITIKSKLSVMINTITVSILEPNGTISTLTNTINNEENFLNNSYSYEHNYTFTPGELGEHIIQVAITDVNYPDSGYVARRNNSFYVNTTQNISLAVSGSGLNNITLNDIYSTRILNKGGTTLSASLVPGNYDTKVSTSKIDTILRNTTINNLVSSLCTFDDIGEIIESPTDSRVIDEFTLNCPDLTFSYVNMTYNYTNVLGSVTHEDNLKIYKCNSVASCSWERLNISLVTDQNLITSNLNNFSVFALSEDTVPVGVTTVVSSGGAGGGGSGGGLSRLVAIEIIKPGNMTIYADDIIITPLTIKNTGKTSLFGITLTAATQTKGINLFLDKSFITALAVGEESAANLKIISREFTEDNAEIVVTAKVTTPSLQDQVKFLIRSIGGVSEKGKAEEQLRFVNELFSGNPECLELKELVNQAQAALDNKQYTKALSIADSAIQSCKNLLSLQGKEVKLAKKPTAISDILILSIEALVFFILTYGMYNYYKRRRLKNLK
jgi:hypothetical protein